MSETLHSKRPVRVLLFIGELSAGGAERQFIELAKGLHSRGMPIAIMLNREGGEFFQEVQAHGIALHILDLRGIRSLLGYFIRARKVINAFKPTVLYGFMGSGIKSSILTLIDRKIKVIWGIRSALTEEYHAINKLRIASFIDRFFSPLADALICNSTAGVKAIVKRGFRNKRIRVINNGIDAQLFRFDANARNEIRQSWKTADDTILIGMVGRLHPDKNHLNFMRSARILLNDLPNVRFVCIGNGEESYVAMLRDYASSMGLSNVIVWAGHQSNMAGAYAALDVLVSASNTEAFPNVLAEAMCIGLPVVTTDVGDCGRIIGNCGWLVPPGDSDALAIALRSAILGLPFWDKQASRQRIIDNYSIEAMLDKTLAVIAEVSQD